MKVTFTKETVFSGLQNAISVIPSKTGAAYLRTIWIIADNNTVTFQSTDANMEFTGSYAAEVEEPGMVGVHGQIFYGLLNNCTGSIELEYKEDDILYLHHRNGVCKLPVVTQNWYQSMVPFPDENVIYWTGEFLQTAITQVFYCIDEDSSLDALTCLLIKPQPLSPGKMDICGLNGHQFAMYSMVHEDMVAKLPNDGLLIQKIYLQQITKWLPKGEILINYDDKRIFLKKNNNEVLSVPRAIYPYPDYNNFLNKLKVDSVSYLNLHRSDLKSALQRISTVNNDIKNCTDFYIAENRNMINCSAKGETSGEVLEKFAVEYDGDIKRITFRTKDLLTILDHFSSEDITMKMTTNEGPCAISGDDDPFYLVVVMPIKTVESVYESEESV